MAEAGGEFLLMHVSNGLLLLLTIPSRIYPA